MKPVYYTILGYFLCIAYVNILIHQDGWGAIFKDLHRLTINYEQIKKECDNKNFIIKELKIRNAKLLKELGEYDY